MHITAKERFERAKKHQKDVSNRRTNKRSKSVLSPAVVVKHRNSLLQKQLGFCAICTNEITEGTRLYYLDHCHETGQIRGVLCHNCNVGLGHFKDDPELLLLAIDYLNKFRPKHEKVEWQLKPKISANGWKEAPPEIVEQQLERMTANRVEIKIDASLYLSEEEFDKLPGKDKIAYLKEMENKKPWWHNLPDVLEITS